VNWTQEEKTPPTFNLQSFLTVNEQAERVRPLNKEEEEELTRGSVCGRLFGGLRNG
jgi:hypothetical protein